MATGGLNVSSQLNSSDIIEECDVIRSCEPCSRDDSSTKATVFCKVCKELLCDDCSKPPTKYKPGRHEIVSIQDMVSAAEIVDMKNMDVCQEHGKAIKFYCEDHSELCCSRCVFKHRKCDNVDEIATISLTKEPEFQVMKHALVKMESESDSIIADCKKSKNELNESIANISDEGDLMKNRIVKHFEEAQQKMFTEANQFKAKVCMQLDERQTTATQIKEQINQILPMYSAVLEHGTPEQKYILLKKTEEQQDTIKTQIDGQMMAKITTKCSLSFSTELLALLKMENPVFQMNFEECSKQIESSYVPPYMRNRGGANSVPPQGRDSREGGGYNNYNQGGGGYRGGGRGSYNNYQGGGYGNRGYSRGGGYYYGGYQPRGGGNDRGGYQPRGGYNSGGSGSD